MVLYSMPRITLRDYQLEAIENMKNGCILCGDVGTGKSITSLAFFIRRMCGGLISSSKLLYPMDLYIITTARKRDTLEWEKDMANFALSTNPEVCSYGIKVVVDSWNNIGKYTEVENAFFIFDEQRVVGYGAWTKHFLKITKSNKWILLSATPGDVWKDYIPVFIANGFYKNKTEFERRHCVFSRFSKFPQIERYIEEGILNARRRQILVTMDMKRKTVPHHEYINCSYDIIQYKDILRNRWNPFEDKPIETSSELCQCLRRVVNTDDSRLIAYMDICAQHNKVIVFYNYNYELDILKSQYYGDDVVVAEWNGHCHQSIPDSKKWVYLVQYTAGAEGWNCIETDTIIFYSQNYSYKIMKQSSGRIDRMNTPFVDLYYYHLKSAASIDLAISKAIKSKKKFNENAFADRKR